MHIAHFVDYFSPLSETFIYNYVVGLRRRGHTSHVVTLHRAMETERPYDDVSMLDMPPRWSPARMTISLRRRLGLVDLREQFFPLTRKAALAILQQRRPDVIHAHFGSVGVMILPVARQLEIPLIVSFHGFDAAALSRIPRWQRNYQALAHQVDGVIANSSHTHKRLEAIGFAEKTIHTIHVGSDLSMFSYSDPSARFDGKHVHCLHVGRLIPVKSPIQLVNAFNLARQSALPAIDLQLTIAGDGPLREPLQEEIRRLGLDDSVKVLGKVDHAQVKTLMQQAHIYTQYCEKTPDGQEEALGMAFVEAAASGLPVVSTRSGGIPDVVLDQKTGYLVEEKDIDGMAQRIVDLAHNPQQWRQFGLAGREHVEANFSLDQQIDHTLALYEQALTSSEFHDNAA